jgi:hypothetical protein
MNGSERIEHGRLRLFQFRDRERLRVSADFGMFLRNYRERLLPAALTVFSMDGSRPTAEPRRRKAISQSLKQTSIIMHYPDREAPGRRDRSEAVSKSATVETLPRNRIGKHKLTYQDKFGIQIPNSLTGANRESSGAGCYSS